MGRHWYTSRSYREALERLAARMPALGLGADVIAGFPGETGDDHAATLALVHALPFSYLHVFPYSLRPGTAAERLGGQVHGEIVAERAAALRAAGEAKAADYRARRAGGGADVIVIGDAAKKHGLTGDFLEVDLADPSVARGARFDALLSAAERGRLLATPAGVATHNSESRIR
jgi:threonylcarbamoyladenosine tRNA methylthiotransferase MtaB